MRDSHAVLYALQTSIRVIIEMTSRLKFQAFAPQGSRHYRHSCRARRHPHAGECSGGIEPAKEAAAAAATGAATADAAAVAEAIAAAVVVTVSPIMVGVVCALHIFSSL